MTESVEETDGGHLKMKYNLDGNIKTYLIKIYNANTYHAIYLYSNVTKKEACIGHETQDRYLVSLFIHFDKFFPFEHIKPYHHMADFYINKLLTSQEQQIVNDLRKNAQNYIQIHQFIDHVKRLFDVKLMYNEKCISLYNINNHYISDLNYLQNLECYWIQTDSSTKNLDEIIIYICEQIYSKYKNCAKCYLLKYDLNDRKTYYSYSKRHFEYFKNICNVELMQEINCSSSIILSTQQKMFIQINFEEEYNRQNYYLFLPTLSIKTHIFYTFFSVQAFYDENFLSAVMEESKNIMPEKFDTFMKQIVGMTLKDLNINDVFLLCNNQNLKYNKLESKIFCCLLSSDEFAKHYNDILPLINSGKEEYKKLTCNSKEVLNFNSPCYYIYYKFLENESLSECIKSIIILIKKYCVEYGKKYEKYNDERFYDDYLLAMGDDYILNNRFDEIVTIIQSYNREKIRSKQSNIFYIAKRGELIKEE
ncbi:hypothetical protein COBT_000565 [Conglomerata obtusa]